MLNRYARAFFTRVLTPTARFLLRLGVGPDTVTLLGTLGVCASAILCFPRGWMLGGTLAVTAFIFSDLLDGTMARLSGRTSKWGGFLDATLDRFGDAAIFGSLAYYFAVHDKLGMFLACMICLISGSVTSYARAKAESLGFRCDVGYIERGERLVGSLVSTGLDGLGVPFVQAVAFWALAAGSTCTVVQRMLYVRKQALVLAAAGQGGLDDPNAPAASPTSTAPTSTDSAPPTAEASTSIDSASPTAEAPTDSASSTAQAPSVGSAAAEPTGAKPVGEPEPAARPAAEPGTVPKAAKPVDPEASAEHAPRRGATNDQEAP